MYFCFSVGQANTPSGLALGLAAVWERHKTKNQTTTAPQTSLDILKRLSCMQVCLDECHRVGMKASNLFPGSGASMPTTTGVLWPGTGSLFEPQRVSVWKQRRKMQVCWEVQVEMEMCMSGGVWRAEREREKDQGSMKNFETGHKYTVWKDFWFTAWKNCTLASKRNNIWNY